MDGSDDAELTTRSAADQSGLPSLPEAESLNNITIGRQSRLRRGEDISGELKSIKEALIAYHEACEQRREAQQHFDAMSRLAREEAGATGIDAPPREAIHTLNKRSPASQLVRRLDAAKRTFFGMAVEHFDDVKANLESLRAKRPELFNTLSRWASDTERNTQKALVDLAKAVAAGEKLLGRERPPQSLRAKRPELFNTSSRRAGDTERNTQQTLAELARDVAAGEVSLGREPAVAQDMARPSRRSRWGSAIRAGVSRLLSARPSLLRRSRQPATTDAAVRTTIPTVVDGIAPPAASVTEPPQQRIPSRDELRVQRRVTHSNNTLSQPVSQFRKSIGASAIAEESEGSSRSASPASTLSGTVVTSSQESLVSPTRSPIEGLPSAAGYPFPASGSGLPYTRPESPESGRSTPDSTSRDSRSSTPDYGTVWTHSTLRGGLPPLAPPPSSSQELLFDPSQLDRQSAPLFDGGSTPDSDESASTPSPPRSPSPQKRASSPASSAPLPDSNTTDRPATPTRKVQHKVG
jgi:hypothetical protein